MYNWIKIVGESIEKIKSSEAIEVVELEELHTYIRHKKIAVVSGLLFIDLGNNSSIFSLEQKKSKLVKNSEN